MSKKWLVESMDMACQKGKGLWADSLFDALEGITPEQAGWKPEGKDVRSIQEIVNHIISGKRFLLSVLEGKKPSFEESEGGSLSWEEVVKELTDVHNKVISMLRERDIDIDEKLPGGDSAWGELLYGILAHDCYHTGQIILLKGLQGI